MEKYRADNIETQPDTSHNEDHFRVLDTWISVNHAS